MFPFNFYPVIPVDYPQDWIYHTNKGFEPWKFHWDGNYDNLRNSCYNDAPMLGMSGLSGKTYCSALIQNNNWTIPKDYPHKVRY